MNIAGRGAVGVLIVQRQVALVNAIQTPGCIVLGCIDGHDSIFFNEVDAVIIKKSDQRAFVGPDDKTGQNLGIGLNDFCIVLAGDAPGHGGHGNIAGAFGLVGRQGLVLENNDVLVFNWLLGGKEFSSVGGGKKGEGQQADAREQDRQDRKSTRLNSSHVAISYAVFCLKKKKKKN